MGVFVHLYGRFRGERERFMLVLIFTQCSLEGECMTQPNFVGRKYNHRF